MCAIFLASLFWSFLCLHVTPMTVFGFFFFGLFYVRMLPQRLPTNRHRLPTNRHRLPTNPHRRAYWTLRVFFFIAAPLGVMRYGSIPRKFILSVSVASLPIVQWKLPPLRVVEAIVLRSVDDLRFPGTFVAVPPRSFLFTVFHKYIRTLLRKNPPSDDLLTALQQTVPPSTIAGQRNVDIQTMMRITRLPKPKPEPKPKPGKPVAKPAPPPPPDFLSVYFFSVSFCPCLPWPWALTNCRRRHLPVP